jgi:ABC-type glycerol-3-phosphate transport system substrate-binding protein
VLAGGAAAGTLVPAVPAFAQTKSSASGTVRVWGEPGPYGGVAVDGMNEWAAKFAPGLKFQIESLSWDSVYVKLMTDLAARRPANCISVESPIAMQLMAQGLLEPLDDVVGRSARTADQGEVGYWGAWKGKQYVLGAPPAHLLIVRKTCNELGLGDPDKWDWNDLLKAAQTITEKKKDMAGISLALGRNLCTDYHFAALLHSAGGRMFDPSKQFEVVFDSPATVEALEYVKALLPYMPKGAVGNSFLEVVDSIATGKAAMAFYWGRPYGRVWDENKEIFKNLESYNHAHPKTGNRATGTTSRAGASQGQPYIKEVKAALAYYQTSRLAGALLPFVI